MSKIAIAPATPNQMRDRNGRAGSGRETSANLRVIGAQAYSILDPSAVLVTNTTPENLLDSRDR